MAQGRGQNEQQYKENKHFYEPVFLPYPDTILLFIHAFCNIEPIVVVNARILYD